MCNIVVGEREKRFEGVYDSDEDIEEGLAEER